MIPLQTRLRYTTMIVLPEDEEILDVICGDKDFWVISATHNIAHVKPAKEGATTNLNLVTASGTVYSFLSQREERHGTPDLKVYVNADPAAPRGKPKYYSAAQVEGVQHEVGRGAQCRRRRAQARHRDDRRVPAAVPIEAAVRVRHAQIREAVPRASDLARRAVHVPQDRCDRIAGALRAQGRQAGARELPGHNGTYVVPKVLDRGYLALGKAQFSFSQQER